MRRWALHTLLLFPLAASAQSIVTDQPQQCVWHAGDNPAWAAPNLDESGWQPSSVWNPAISDPHIWVRCHANLMSLDAADQPALQIALYAAYQLYADGRLIGSAGNLQSGAFTMNTVRQWPLPSDSTSPAVIALRITRLIVAMAPVGAVPPLEIRAGALSSLRDSRSNKVLANIQPHLLPAVCFSIIGVVGFVLLALYLNDRSRLDLLLLGINGVSLPLIYLDYLGAAAFLSYPVAAYFALWAIPATTNNVCRTLFFFAIARRRMPWIIWVLIFLATCLYPISLAVTLLAPAQAVWLDLLRSHQITAVSEFAGVLESFAPLAAFLPWRNLSRRMKPLAILCMAWGATMTMFFTVRFTGTRVSGIPDLAARWSGVVSDFEAIATLSVVVALLALLFREQQQTAHDRAVLAGELHAAGEIQRMLAPTVLECAPGLRIDVAFHPMREVGGDFYLCRILPDGRQRVLVGDVSGKGSAAAMTAALLLGAAASRTADSPADLLLNLNRVMAESRVGGFATCLCADFASDGHVTLANAGHLSPYLRGQEIPLSSALPLGLDSGIAAYQSFELTLLPGQSLTLISDGVVEARNPAGELFGFERTAAISTESAQKIASAAQAFGQEDDITVLTLTYAPAEVLHA